MIQLKKTILYILLLLPVAAMSQGFHFNETSITFTKDVSFGTVHGYIEIISDTADTLPMMWVAHKAPDFPSAWYVNFDDQNQYHAPVEDLDSANFNLYPSSGFNQKLIIGLAHNNRVDTSSIFFTVFPAATPADSVRIEYKFQIPYEIPDTSVNDTADTSTFVINRTSANLDFDLFWNEGWEFHSTEDVDELLVYDVEGKLVYAMEHKSYCQLPSRIVDQVLIVITTKNGASISKKVARQSY